MKKTHPNPHSVQQMRKSPTHLHDDDPSKFPDEIYILSKFFTNFSNQVQPNSYIFIFEGFLRVLKLVPKNTIICGFIQQHYGGESKQVIILTLLWKEIIFSYLEPWNVPLGPLLIRPLGPCLEPSNFQEELQNPKSQCYQCVHVVYTSKILICKN